MKVSFCWLFSTAFLVLLFVVGTHFGISYGAIVDQEVLDLAGSQDQLNLKVFLTHQPGHRIALAEKQVFQPEFDRLSLQIQYLIEPFAIGIDVIPKDIRDRLRDINTERDALLSEMRQVIYARIEPEIQPQQDRVKFSVTNTLQGQVYAQITFVNVLGVEIRAIALEQMANHPDVAEISLDHKGQPELDKTAPSIGATSFWSNGYDGNGTWDVAVVDSGVSLDHPALSAHKQSGSPYINAMTNRPDQNHPDDDHGHGTAMAGIIVSTNSTYRGIAYGLRRVVNCKVMTGNYEPRETEVWNAIDWALNSSRSPYPYAHESAEIINLSLGFDIVNGYSDTAKFLDAVVDDLHVMVVTSAGNRGTAGVTQPGEMYNGMTVANMDIGSVPPTVYSTSSRGPIVNNRKKPDVIAPGTYVKTTRRDWLQTQQQFGTWTNGLWGQVVFTGTSCAAAHVTGAVALLYDYLSAWPKTLKAVLINTADDKGSQGWDGSYGWGYINLATALLQWRYDEVGLNQAGSNFDRYYWSCTLSPGGKITTVWNREVDYGYPGVPVVYPLDNVDLNLYDYTGGVKGIKLASSVSTVDNVEQVVYNGTTSKRVLVEVRNMTSNSAAYVSVAFPVPFTREGSGPLAPARMSNLEHRSMANELGQNFPNPFNPETWIPYAINKESVVLLRIFDAKGRLVQQIDLGNKPAGRYFSRNRAAYWDGRNESGERVSSGVYFYYLTAGEFAATCKMVVSE